MTDGEMRRWLMAHDMADQWMALLQKELPREWKGPGGRSKGARPRLRVRKLRKVRKLTGHEVPFLKKNAHDRSKSRFRRLRIFMLASLAGITGKFYLTHAGFVKDLAEIARDEVQWLSRKG